MGYEKYGYLMYRWQIGTNDFDNEKQTMEHIVLDFRGRKFQGRLNDMELTRVVLKCIITLLLPRRMLIDDYLCYAI